MNIYIDESGSFVNASTTGAWNAVAALAVSEASNEKLRQQLDKLKRCNGCDLKKEVKLKDLTEGSYYKFLRRLADLNIVVFSTATDSGVNTVDRVIKHQQGQVAEILKHIDKMKYEGGRQGVQLVSRQLASLPPQLYVQLQCQIQLMYDVVCRVITYYAQREPTALAEFRWRIDQKNISRTDFEDAFEKLSPALLQTMSLSKPLMMVEGFDYSHLNRQYEFEDGKAPDYLKEFYGIEIGSSLNIQKIIRGNIKFTDSLHSPGVQAVDLVVSGIRRCLRRQFLDNEKAASMLGRLMLQAEYNAPPLSLLSFDNARQRLPLEVARLVRAMSKNCKPMLLTS